MTTNEAMPEQGQVAVTSAVTRNGLSACPYGTIAVTASTTSESVLGAVQRAASLFPSAPPIGPQQ